MPDKATIKRLYALAAGLDMAERSEPEDAFHQLVYGITEKEHVSDLTDLEAKAVEAELLKRMQFGNRSKPLKKKQHESVPGMMTADQKRYAWYLAYRLKELDTRSPDTPVNERLAGAVQKILGITAPPDNPLVWVNFKNGSRLIEGMKRYVRSAEKKARKK